MSHGTVGCNVLAAFVKATTTTRTGSFAMFIALDLFRRACFPPGRTRGDPGAAADDAETVVRAVLFFKALVVQVLYIALLFAEVLTAAIAVSTWLYWAYPGDSGDTDTGLRRRRRRWW